MVVADQQCSLAPSHTSINIANDDAAPIARPVAATATSSRNPRDATPTSPHRSTDVSLTSRPSIDARIGTQLPRTRRPLTHRPGWLNRPEALPHTNSSGPVSRSLTKTTKTMGTAWASHGQNRVLGTQQAPSKGCLTCGFAWSGRRDSNPRPSPWQGDALPLSHFRVLRETP